MDASSIHIAMYPWFAMGHNTAYLHLANKLAERGCKISFFIPRRTQSKLEHFNLNPHLITFITINIPRIDGLPHEAETTADVSRHLFPLLMTAMDNTEKDIDLLLRKLKPNFVFFDFAYWLPNLAKPLGIKCVAYWIISPCSAAYTSSEGRRSPENDINGSDLMEPPADFPDSSIKLHAHEARKLAGLRNFRFGSGVLFYNRIYTGLRLSDAIAFKGCREIEGPYADYLESQYKKPILLSGPVLPVPSSSTLEEKWAQLLGKFEPGSVIYCAFGSECILEHNQFQELVLGLELTGMPFLAALKPPTGFQSVEEALPEGFQERVRERGVVHGGWVQQTLILKHTSVGCFITHCGAGSLLEALLIQSQMVLLPNLSDQVLNARVLSRSLKVGVEVEKGEEDGLFTKESVCEAVKIAMDDEGKVSKEIRSNHSALRNLLLVENLESTYLDNFCHKLYGLLNNLMNKSEVQKFHSIS